jgi:hypothetical protein
VEDEAVVEALAGELGEVLDRLRRLVREELELDRSFAGVKVALVMRDRTQGSYPARRCNTLGHRRMREEPEIGEMRRVRVGKVRLRKLPERQLEGAQIARLLEREAVAGVLPAARERGRGTVPWRARAGSRPATRMPRSARRPARTPIASSTAWDESSTQRRRRTRPLRPWRSPFRTRRAGSGDGRARARRPSAPRAGWPSRSSVS